MFGLVIASDKTSLPVEWNGDDGIYTIEEVAAHQLRGEPAAHIFGKEPLAMVLELVYQFAPRTIFGEP